MKIRQINMKISDKNKKKLHLMRAYKNHPYKSAFGGVRDVERQSVVTNCGNMEFKEEFVFLHPVNKDSYIRHFVNFENKQVVVNVRSTAQILFLQFEKINVQH